MSIHRVSPFASKAATVLVLLGADVTLSAAIAESVTQALPRVAAATTVAQSHSGAQAKRAVRSCRIIDRPKHTIVHCDCTGDPLAGISSVDGAAILRLFVGNPRCRAPVAARQ